MKHTHDYEGNTQVFLSIPCGSNPLFVPSPPVSPHPVGGRQPEYLMKIVSGAFAHSGKICTVVFPESLNSIDSLAFYRCGGLQKVVLPEHLHHLGLGAFAECRSL